MQVGVLLATLAACVLGAPSAAMDAPAAVTSEQEQQPMEPGPQPAAESEGHARDKRRLPDPGFVIPATPMGFTKQQQQQSQPQQAPAGAHTNPREKHSVQSNPREKHSVQSPPRQKRLFYPHGSASAGRDEHMKALQNFLGQTRKLGVPDEQALKLLDKELNKAKRQQGAQRPVYHATPLKPYGSLINFNSAPYEKHQLKGPMKPIREQQNDIPPPTKPLVVESDRQILRSAAAAPGAHTEAVVVPSGPLPVSVPMLVQTQQAQQQAPQQYPAQKHTTALALPSAQPSGQAAYQAVALPVQAYQQQPAYQPSYQTAYQPLEAHATVLQEAHLQHAVESHDPSDNAVNIEALQSYAPQQEEHVVHRQPLVVPQSVQHVQVQQVQEVQQGPVYVYEQEQARVPEAEVHVELPKQVAVVEPAQHAVVAAPGLYREQKEHQEYASQYRFGYRVRDEHGGNDFGHAETREGKMTKGEYFVTLPDGRLQSVKYWADPSGYHAHVSYTNHASHPAPAPQHQPHQH